MIIVVTRETLSPCCIGRMLIDGVFYGYTLERPWLDNKPMVSAIPAGIYPVTITRSPKFGRNMLLIHPVPGRSGIRIHNANHWSQLNGCLAVARNRVDAERIQGGLSNPLTEMVHAAIQRKEAVRIQFVNLVAADGSTARSARPLGGSKSSPNFEVK